MGQFPMRNTVPPSSDRDARSEFYNQLLIAASKSLRDDEYQINCCISASAVLAAVLEVYDVKVTELPCRFVAMNAEAAEACEEIRKDFPCDPENLKGRKPAVILIGDSRYDKDSERGWCGHLVIATEDGFILDGSAAQVTRKEHGIEVGQYILVDADGMAQHGFLAKMCSGKLDAEVAGRGDNGCYVSYRPTLENRRYRDVDAWRRPIEHSVAIMDTLEAMIGNGYVPAPSAASRCEKYAVTAVVIVAMKERLAKHASN